MSLRKLRQLFAAGMVAALVFSSTAVVGVPAAWAAPVAQEEVRAQAVSGVLTGGQFAKVWLGLEPETRNMNVVVTTEWGLDLPAEKGVGFYVLDDNGLNRVVTGAADVRDANMGVGSRASSTSPANQLQYTFNATASNYTIVLYNDSATDANFTLSVTNAVITDDQGQVRDLSATPTPADGDEAATDEETEDTEATEAAATPEPAATAVTTATTTTTSTTTTTETTVAETTVEEAAPTAIGVPGVVRAQTMRGELTEQNEQHYLALEPSERDGRVTLTLSYDPQDSSELSRRLNFWVLSEASFNQIRTGTGSTNPGQLALAAGSSEPGLAGNQRRAVFTASGTGTYTVIVYNNSTVPATYELQVDGGILVDDSLQTLTAQQGVTTTGTLTGTVVSTTTTGTTGTVTGGTTTTPAAGARTGTPGGTYVVQAGDTLSLIARDIYGDLSLWDEICAYNNLSNCNVIEVGDSLRLPTQAEITAGIAPAAAPAAATTATTATETTTATPAAEEEETPAASETLTSTTTLTETESTTSTETTTDTSEAGEGAAPTASVDLVAAMEASGNFNTLLQALDAANLTASLRTPGPFTIFAPTDAAFAKQPIAGVLDALLASPSTQLTNILLFHVLSGEVASADIANGAEAVTQQGQSVRFQVTGDTIKINDSNVVGSDITATNGIIHAIDTVMLVPPAP